MVLIALGGCHGLSQRYRRDDVVLARQIARQGADAFHAGDWNRAADYYAKAVEVCPVDERVRARYAETMWRQGLYREAIEHQQEAVRLSGGEPNLLVRLGEMYLAQGELDEAGEIADRVVNTGREMASAYRLRGDVLARRGHWQAALAAYHRALSIQPDMPGTQMAVARVYQQEGRAQRALSTLQSLATSYGPGEEPPELLYRQAQAFAALGRYRQAVDKFTLAQARGFQSPDLLFQLAESHWLVGNRSAAQWTLDQALRASPQHPLAARVRHTMADAPRVAQLGQ